MALFPDCQGLSAQPRSDDGETGRGKRSMAGGGGRQGGRRGAPTARPRGKKVKVGAGGRSR